jgi:methionyl-tRNA synthetase
MTATTEILWESLGAHSSLGAISDQKVSQIATWGQLPQGAAVTKTPVLFPRLEIKE